MRFLKWALIVYAVVALISGGLAAAVAWDHDPLSAALLFGLGWPYTAVQIILPSN